MTSSLGISKDGSLLLGDKTDRYHAEAKILGIGLKKVKGGGHTFFSLTSICLREKVGKICGHKQNAAKSKTKALEVFIQSRKFDPDPIFYLFSDFVIIQFFSDI